MKNLIYLSFVIGLFSLMAIGLYVFMQPYQHIEAYSTVRKTLKEDIPKTLAEGKEIQSAELQKIKTLKEVKNKMEEFENPKVENVPQIEGKKSYIVTINISWLPDGYLSEEQIKLQKIKLEDAKDQIIRDVEIVNDEIIKSSMEWTIPSFAVIVDDIKLEELKKHPLVARVEDNSLESPNSTQ